MRRQYFRSHFGAGVGASLRVERLEARRPLAVFTVTTHLDVVDDADAATSLREAVAAANALAGPDVIGFDLGPQPARIVLTQGELLIADALRMTGPGANLLTIDGNLADRVLRIDDGNPDVDSPVTIEGVALTGGYVRSSFALYRQGRGGAVLSDETLHVVRSVISGNSSSGGGGIYAAKDVTIEASEISGNASYWFGGGGVAAGGNVFVTASTLAGNRVDGYSGLGGGISAKGDVTITSSTLAANEANQRGGAMHADGLADIRQSTISGNLAGTGGAIAAASVKLFASTVTGNIADFEYGGVYAGYGEIVQSIVAGNFRDNNGIVFVPEDLSGGPFLLGFSLVGAPLAPIYEIKGTTNYFDVDPLLGPLADNGGPTWTHALLPGSRAIDRGDPSFQQRLDEYDQRGAPFLRVMDGDLLTDIAIDIGAYETQSPPNADFDASGAVTGRDFMIWQRGFGGSDASLIEGDSDGDNDVDASDLRVWEVMFGTDAELLAANFTANSESSAAQTLTWRQLSATADASGLPSKQVAIDAAFSDDNWAIRGEASDRAASSAARRQLRRNDGSADEDAVTRRPSKVLRDSERIAADDQLQRSAGLGNRTLH